MEVQNGDGVKSPQRPLSERLQDCYTGAVHDVLRELGYQHQVLPSSIRPLHPGSKVAGPAFTASGHYRVGLDPHETLLAWTGFLAAAPAGSVVVCQPNDHSLAHMGELSAETLQLRGVRGFIVDGGSRDADFIKAIGLPVFCRYLTPADIVGRWLAEGLGEPVMIGESSIRTGDYVLGDSDGVVVVPADAAEAVVTRTEEVMSTESELRNAIRRGMDPQQAYLRYRMF